MIGMSSVLDKCRCRQSVCMRWQFVLALVTGSGQRYMCKEQFSRATSLPPWQDWSATYAVYTGSIVAVEILRSASSAVYCAARSSRHKGGRSLQLHALPGALQTCAPRRHGGQESA